MNICKDFYFWELLLSKISKNRRRRRTELYFRSRFRKAIDLLFSERLRDWVCPKRTHEREKRYGHPKKRSAISLSCPRLLIGNNREQKKEESTMPKEVNFEANLELQKAISYLEEIVSSLKDGKVVVERAQDFVVLEPTHQVQMELEVAAEEEHEKIKVKLSWEKPIEYDLKISSIEPVVKTEEEVEADKKW
jgi:amphi-Trp domain-containing protein